MRIMSALLLAGFLIAGPAVAQVGKNTDIQDPNLADAKTLSSLPHMNDQLAAAVIAARPFVRTQQLDIVLSAKLDAKQRTELYGKLFLPINLNTASEAEVMLIPGMSKRMAHEFEEYRPYKSMDQFRKEIGKYVDAAEVARFEQYVFVPMNLNTASSADFATIPGMTKKMVHEFEEYRPYKSMDQFRKEIGKYVDKNEVARFEQYVTLN